MPSIVPEPTSVWRGSREIISPNKTFCYTRASTSMRGDVRCVRGILYRLTVHGTKIMPKREPLRRVSHVVSHPFTNSTERDPFPNSEETNKERMRWVDIIPYCVRYYTTLFSIENYG